MHWHWINENRVDDKVIGSGFWAGRGWLYLNDDYGSQQKTIHVEWYFGKHAQHTGIEMRTDFVNEREINFNIGLSRLFGFWLSIRHPVFPSWDYKHGDRQIGLRVFDGALWIDLWRNDEAWDNRSWRDEPIVIRPADILFGRRKHSERKLTVHEVNVTLPDGQFPAHIQMVLSEWKRPRWPFPLRIKRAHIELKKPIPIPGKGENSWDLDDDAIFSMTCAANSVEEAVAHLVQSALRDRRRYGGSLDWKPESE